MRPHVFNLTPADDSLSGYVASATGATWTLTATTAADNMGHLVIVTNLSATDHSAKTIALTGTDPDGFAQTETINMPNSTANAASTVTSTRYFRTLTSAVPSETIGTDDMNIGWTDDAVSSTFVPDFKMAPFNVSIGCDISGTINYDIQHTFDNVFDKSGSNPYSGWTWMDHSSLAAKTADADGNYAAPVRGVRILTNSLSSGATIKVTITQGSV